jgi:hypothetical protein
MHMAFAARRGGVDSIKAAMSNYLHLVPGT